MAENCENNILLKRDCTARDRRMLRALLPQFAAVDDRSLADLIQFAREFAGEIRFFAAPPAADVPDWSRFLSEHSDRDLSELTGGDAPEEERWLRYITAKKGYTQPQQALFLAFLKLFKLAIEDLNSISARHLSYYYEDVLRLRKKPALPDHVFTIFELARHVRDSHLVPAGTLLRAGKDANGRPLLFATADELTVNRGQVASLKALYRNRTGDGRLHASFKADSADGVDAEPETTDGSWRTFGSPAAPAADIGFVISSPSLQLSEGERKITFRLNCTPGSREALTALAASAGSRIDELFRVEFSGEDGWIEPDIVLADAEGRDESVLERKILSFMNRATADEIMAKIKDDPTTGYSEDRPGYGIGRVVAQAIVDYRRNGERPFRNISELRRVSHLGPDKVNDILYTFRKKLSLTRINPDAGLIVLARSLDESKPAVTSQQAGVYETHFGTRWPVARIRINQKMAAAGRFPLGLLEQIRITRIEADIDVIGVKNNIIANDFGNQDPAKPFMPFGNRPVRNGSFFIGNREVLQSGPTRLVLNLSWQNLPQQSFSTYYGQYTGHSFSNEAFQAQAEVLQNRKWDQLGGTRRLFDDDTSPRRNPAAGPPPAPTRSIDLLEGTGLTLPRNPEMAAISGITPEVKDGFIRLRLGNRDFGHHVFSQVYARAVMAHNPVSGTPPPPLPNDPYTPVIDGLSLDFSSRFAIAFGESGKVGPDVFLHLHPFGFERLGAAPASVALIPAHPAEGALCIGLEDFKPGRNISLLFQVSEGSANPDLPVQPLEWSYLAGSTWKPLDNRRILSDGTRQLLTSGIIRFSIPDDATTAHTLMPGDLLWLRCTAAQNTGAVSSLISVRAQAVQAAFDDRGNDPSRLADPLPAETISKLKDSDAAIKSVEQPFESFGGAEQEEQQVFERRVSERLRHKRRAITIWDYERLVLENFPEVYKVKCLNHIRYTGTLRDYSEIAPGNVSLILVPATINRNSVDPLKPKASLLLLEQISDFISGIKPEAVKLWVRNPLYEEISVSFDVKFRKGRDRGHYQEQLEKDIITFLSPWASRGTADVVFGGRVHQSMIIHFIEKLPYVDFVSCFSMNHIISEPVTGTRTVRRDVPQAEASTAASVLGSAAAHQIRVLEEEGCGDCEHNLVEAFRERKTDDCGCGGNS